MASIRSRLDQFKDNPTELIDSDAVRVACREAGHRWRVRTLDPLGTLHAFAVQIAHGNAAISHLTRIMARVGVEFTESAYCQARARLPVAAVRAALEAFVARVRLPHDPADGLWYGHRTALIDGTDINTPDSPELRAAFGASKNSPTCTGLPIAHTLAIFDARHGLLLGMHASAAHTHDQRHAHDLHPALGPGDVLVGDRGFTSYVHLHRLAKIGCHGVFRASASWKIPFPAQSGERTRHAYNRHRRHEPILVQLIGPDDQVIQIVKPHNRPKHITPEEFAEIPSHMVVRVVRYRLRTPGMRTREVTLLTTLIDAKKYPARAIADLYGTRWRIEVNLRHLKRTMGMDRLKCQSVEGVAREMLMFALVYNAVCHVRTRVASDQGFDPARLSFVDALRAVTLGMEIASSMLWIPPALKRWPTRQPRTHPRQLKRLHSHFTVMTRPRSQSTTWLLNRHSIDN